MKKTVALLMVVLMVCSLAACAQQSGSTEQPKESAAAEAPASEQPAVEAPKEEKSADAQETAAFVPAAQIELPTGKSAYVLPVDKAAEKTVKIAFVGNDLNEFCILVHDGVDWATEALKDRNAQVDYYGLPEFDAVATEEVIRNCINLEYDGIVCFGFSEVLQKVIQEATDAGIPVVTWNTDAGEGSARMGFFGENPLPAATRLGEFAYESFASDQGGEYAVITGSFSVYSHQLRCEGFQTPFKADDKWTCVSETENNDKSDTAYSTTESLLLANPNLKFIYVAAGGPEGAAKAIQDAGLTGQVKLFCHDWTQETVRYAKAGVVTGCLDQDPFNQGAAPVITLYNYIVANEPIADTNYFSGGIMTPDNVNEYYPD